MHDTWAAEAFKQKPMFGDAKNVSQASAFRGALSCVQIFSVGLKPEEIHFQKDCHLAGEDRVKRECPGEAVLYEGKCFDVSIDFRSFEDAELACLPAVGESGAYDSRMIWSETRHVLDFVQTVVYDTISETIS